LNCCEALLESGGLQLGLLTEAQFFQIAGEVLADFLGKTGLVKKIFNVTMNFGVSVYPESDELGDVDSVLANQTYLFETSGYYLDNADPMWQTVMNYPEAYREDEMPPKRVQVFPTPNVEGYQIVTLGGMAGYGVLAATSNPNDFDETLSYLTPAGGYGTPSGFGGNPYVDNVNPGYGVRSVKTPSTGNVSMIGTALPFNITNITRYTYVELVPDSFVHYLKYGILARVFSSDNELKDLQKAAYSAARYAEAINICAAILTNLYVEE
jgi:hypothetical protein